MKNEQSIGQWLKWDFKTNGDIHITNKDGNVVYTEYYDKSWCKREFDSQGKVIYLENSSGEIIDKRTLEIIELNGQKYKLIP
jgi:hypothetical protein